METLRKLNKANKESAAASANFLLDCQHQFTDMTLYRHTDKASGSSLACARYYNSRGMLNIVHSLLKVAERKAKVLKSMQDKEVI